MEKLKINPVTGELDLVTVLPTNEELQDSVFIGTLVDTPTINLNYDNTNNEVTATVIDNSIDNVKASDMPANSVKVNNTASTGNPVDYQLPIDTVLGRETTINGGQIVGIPLQRLNTGTTTLISGTRTISNPLLTTTSKAFTNYTSTNPHTSVPITITKGTGTITFATNQIGDNAEFDFAIYF